MTLFGYNLSFLFFSIMVSFRLAAFLLSSPIGSYVSFPSVTIVFSVTVGFLLAPVIPYHLPPSFGTSGLLFFYAVFTEVLVGVMMGFALQVLFVLASVAGDFAGLQIGFSMASLFDPSLGQVPLLAFFFRVLLLMTFFAMNIHHDVLMALCRSYETIPVGLPFFSVAEFVPPLVRFFNSIFLLGLRLGLPVVSVILLFNLMVGIITMTAPQMNFYFNISFIVNMGIGLLIVASGIITLLRFFETGTESLYQLLKVFTTP